MQTYSSFGVFLPHIGLPISTLASLEAALLSGLPGDILRTPIVGHSMLTSGEHLLDELQFSILSELYPDSVPLFSEFS